MSKTKKIKVESKFELRSEQLENLTDFSLQQQINISEEKEKIATGKTKKEGELLKMEADEDLKKLLSYMLSVLGLEVTDPGKVTFFYSNTSERIYLNLKLEKKSVTLLNMKPGGKPEIKVLFDEVINNFSFPHLNG